MACLFIRWTLQRHYKATDGCQEVEVSRFRLFLSLAQWPLSDAIGCHQTVEHSPRGKTIIYVSNIGGCDTLHCDDNCAS
jgi:hypothetical protein